MKTFIEVKKKIKKTLALHRLRTAGKKIPQKGQGLIETLIVLLIISGGAIALVQFEHNLSYYNLLAQQEAEATIFGTTELESMRNFAVINNTSGYNSYEAIDSGSSTSTGQSATYSLSWTVTTSSTTPSYKTIDLTVSWTDSHGNSQTIKLSTIIAGLDPLYEASVV